MTSYVKNISSNKALKHSFHNSKWTKSKALMWKAFSYCIVNVSNLFYRLMWGSVDKLKPFHENYVKLNASKCQLLWTKQGLVNLTWSLSSLERSIKINKNGNKRNVWLIMSREGINYRFSNNHLFAMRFCVLWKGSVWFAVDHTLVVTRDRLSSNSINHYWMWISQVNI